MMNGCIVSLLNCQQLERRAALFALNENQHKADLKPDNETFSINLLSAPDCQLIKTFISSEFNLEFHSSKWLTLWYTAKSLQLLWNEPSLLFVNTATHKCFSFWINGNLSDHKRETWNKTFFKQRECLTCLTCLMRQKWPRCKTLKMPKNVTHKTVFDPWEQNTKGAGCTCAFIWCFHHYQKMLFNHGLLLK